MKYEQKTGTVWPGSIGSDQLTCFSHFDASELALLLLLQPQQTKANQPYECLLAPEAARIARLVQSLSASAPVRM